MIVGYSQKWIYRYHIDLNSALSSEYGIAPGTKEKVPFCRISSAARKKAP